MYTIILPAYNEKENLPILIKKIKSYLKKIKYQIYIIDDHSDDGTKNLIKSLFKKDKKIIYKLRKKIPRSLGKSVGEAILKTKSNDIIVMDSDFNHNPKYILDLINVNNKNKYPMICGSRFLHKKPKNIKLRFWLSKMYNILIRPILGSNVTDNLSGFFYIDKRIIKRRFYKHIFYGYGDYYIRLIHHVQKRHKNIQQISIVYDERKYGISKTKFINIFTKYTLEVLKLKFKNTL